jgi:hypothetical protein
MGKGIDIAGFKRKHFCSRINSATDDISKVCSNSSAFSIYFMTAFYC